LEINQNEKTFVPKNTETQTYSETDT